MYKLFVAAGLAAVSLGVVACGAYGGSTPTDPGNPSTPPDGAMTINVVSVNGAQSFSPNPATVPPGQVVVWHNVDRETHRVVLNDGRLDTGNIAPGAFSPPMTLGATGPYHCSIHPEMVGTLIGNQ